MMKLSDEEVPFVFPQRLGRHRKNERCRICGYVDRLQVQENKGQEFDDFCRVAEVCGRERKSGSCLTLVPSGGAPAVERFGIAWIQLQCLIAVPKSAIVIALVRIR